MIVGGVLSEGALDTDGPYGPEIELGGILLAVVGLISLGAWLAAILLEVLS